MKISKLSGLLLCLFTEYFAVTHSNKVEEHDLAIRTLTEENAKLKEKLEDFEEKFEALLKFTSQSVITKALSARTCYELVRSDPSLESGMYYIDPDGGNVGDLPIYVYCDKLTGETHVVHDSLEKMKVGHCFDPGCYSRQVNYNASMRQIKALIELSPVCDQYIRYDCLTAVFEFNDVQYCWWNDRQGVPKYYWAGSNDAAHTCSCGLNGTCIEPTVRCQCDASAPMVLFDEGVISNKNHLPITSLHFGRTSASYSSGEHTLGPLRCSGSFQSSSSSIPSSCADLWRDGETVSGLYQVKASDGKINSVYCDMRKLPEETGHQTLIGTIDIKSTPVYFTVVRETNYATLGIIPYERALLNVGNAMNVQTGKFTAPKRGIYYFTFTMVSSYPGEYGGFGGLYHNDVIIVLADPAEKSGYSGASAQATLELQAGDIVFTKLRNGSLNSNGDHLTHFTGFLLQEL